MKLLAPLFILVMTQQLSFKQAQLQHSRVKLDYQEKENTVKNYFNQKNLNNQGAQIFLRAFKKEMKLEVWTRPLNKDQYEFLHTYDFCALSGALGPKRKEGDGQVPEGIYQINHFNPLSNFHLSLGLNYPNRSDRILGDSHSPGSAIYIHGNCVTIGCIPITDDKIKELYILLVEATNDGQKNIPVHIYPTRLDAAGIKYLTESFAGQEKNISFWRNLSSIYIDFEKTHKLKPVTIDKNGAYHL
jgi:murein L,D-transpeptidase YafK